MRSLIGLVLALTVLAGTGCTQNTVFTSASSGRLGITPALAEAIVGQPTRFTIYGGARPYAIFYVSGQGQLLIRDAAHVDYLPTSPGQFRFRVESADGQKAEAGGAARY